MSASADILKLRILLCFLETNPKDCGVTKFAKVLDESKSTISRAMIVLEERGLIKRNGRSPALTPEGMKVAIRYAERIEVTINHLTYEGVSVEDAKRDAQFWALYNSEATMNVLHTFSEQYRVKQELRDLHSFNGATLCKKLKDGQYRFPFVFYREHIREGNNLSMANNGFEHPCTLYVQDGVGTITLRVKEMQAGSMQNGAPKQGRVKNLRYFANGMYIRAETNGNVISIPADSLNFVNVGSGVGQVLHGSVCLKMECTCGQAHMPESTAIFTILI